LLNDVRRKYLGDDDVRAKGRHESSSELVYGVGAALLHQRSRLAIA
jgi:hypothetical protein